MRVEPVVDRRQGPVARVGAEALGAQIAAVAPAGGGGEKREY